jgi:hypothetical protein
VLAGLYQVNHAVLCRGRAGVRDRRAAATNCSKQGLLDLRRGLEPLEARREPVTICVVLSTRW